MALSKVKLGELIVPYRKKCGISKLTPYQVSGVNRDKEFFEPSHQVGNDTSNYQEVPPRFFACNLMHVGRDEVLPIAYNHSEKIKYVSPAYSVFSLKENGNIIAEYLFMFLKSTEIDRYFWFQTDSSVRDGMSWGDFCNIEINIPSLEVQQKYVNVYLAMLANQRAYEKRLDDLKLVCDAYIEDLRRKMPCEEIGKYIQQRNERNRGKGLDFVMGLSTKKEFREAQSRVKRDELWNYKIVDLYDITFVPTTDTWKVLAFAVNGFDKPLVVSPIYEVFSVNQEKLLSQYLAIWLSRTEFDRYARFHSWGSARENFSFEDMQEVKIPIPSIEVQQSIAELYKVYNQRKEINEKLKAQIKNLCPILIRGATNS